MLHDPHLWLAILTVACGVGGAVLSRWPRTAERVATPGAGWRLDALLVGLLLLFGLIEVFRLMRLGNPYWVPLGQDFNDFLGHLADVASPAVTYRGGYRYYLYPWLAAPLIHGAGVAPYTAGIGLALVGTGLVPAATYLLGRQLAPRPMAVAAALLGIRLPAVLFSLGHISDYSLTLVLQIGVLATGIHAIRAGRPLAHLAFGVALALLMGSSSKALPTLLLAIPVGLVALPWRSAPRAALSLAALILPIVAMWAAFAAYPREPRPLEYNLYQVEVAYARQQGIPLGPEDYGWPADVDPNDQGSWRVGSGAALRGLPATLGRLRFRPEGYPPLSSRLPGIREGLGQALGLSWLPLLWLLVPGCLAAGVPRASLHRRLLAVAFLAALVASMLVGPTRLPFALRFFQPFAAVAPAVAMAGLALLVRLAIPRRARDADLFWWPLPALALILVFAGPGPLSARSAAAHVTAVDTTSHQLLPMLALRDELEPDDMIVDMTLGYLAAGLYASDARIQVLTEDNHPPFIMRPQEEGRRIVILCGPLHPYHGNAWVDSARKVLLRSERHARLQRCVYEDQEPASSYGLLLGGVLQGGR